MHCSTLALQGYGCGRSDDHMNIGPRRCLHCDIHDEMDIDQAMNAESPMDVAQDTEAEQGNPQPQSLRNFPQADADPMDLS